MPALEIYGAEEILVQPDAFQEIHTEVAIPAPLSYLRPLCIETSPEDKSRERQNTGVADLLGARAARSGVSVQTRGVKKASLPALELRLASTIGLLSKPKLLNHLDCLLLGLTSPAAQERSSVSSAPPISERYSVSLVLLNLVLSVCDSMTSLDLSVLTLADLSAYASGALAPYLWKLSSILKLTMLLVASCDYRQVLPQHLTDHRVRQPSSFSFVFSSSLGVGGPCALVVEGSARSPQQSQHSLSETQYPLLTQLLHEGRPNRKWADETDASF